MPGRAEIQQYRLTASTDINVVGFDIAVNNVALVQNFNAVHDDMQDIEQLVF
jgi:hypothetical protein